MQFSFGTQNSANGATVSTNVSTQPTAPAAAPAKIEMTRVPMGAFIWVSKNGAWETKGIEFVTNGGLQALFAAPEAAYAIVELYQGANRPDAAALPLDAGDWGGMQGAVTAWSDLKRGFIIPDGKGRFDLAKVTGDGTVAYRVIESNLGIRLQQLSRKVSAVGRQGQTVSNENWTWVDGQKASRATARYNAAYTLTNGGLVQITMQKKLNGSDAWGNLVSYFATVMLQSDMADEDYMAARLASMNTKAISRGLYNQTKDMAVATRPAAMDDAGNIVGLMKLDGKQFNIKMLDSAKTVRLYHREPGQTKVMGKFDTSNAVAVALLMKELSLIGNSPALLLSTVIGLE